MKNLSLKLQDNIFADTEKILTQIKMPRNKYINEALAFYNRMKKRQMLAKQLEYESELCADTSMEVLREMEFLDPHLLEEYDWGPEGPPL
jgi:tRNA(Ser,Leu) C12 N-acetylase TAN1